MVYTTDKVFIQTRLKRALTEDGSESQATAFVGFAATEHSSLSTSGTVSEIFY